MPYEVYMNQLDLDDSIFGLFFMKISVDFRF